jgi:hypothetical protein
MAPCVQKQQRFFTGSEPSYPLFPSDYPNSERGEKQDGSRYSKAEKAPVLVDSHVPVEQSSGKHHPYSSAIVPFADAAIVECASDTPPSLQTERFESISMMLLRWFSSHRDNDAPIVRNTKTQPPSGALKNYFRVLSFKFWKESG